MGQGRSGCIHARRLFPVIAGVLGFVFTLAPAGNCRTILLANFDNGYEAVFPLGKGKTSIIPGVTENDLKLADGKFGKGVFIGRGIPSQALNYSIPPTENFPNEGAIEFWFRPEWDSKVRNSGDLDNSYMLFSTDSDPTGFRFVRSHYGWLQFHYSQNYKTKAAVHSGIGSQCFKKGEWAHLAVSWDKEEARLFVNGMLAAVSEKWELPLLGGMQVGLGSRSYGKGSGAYGTFDDLRISDNKKYVSSFELPVEQSGIEKETVKAPVPNLSGEETKAFKERKALFCIDFRNGLVANYAAGAPFGFSNRKLELEKAGPDNVIRLKQHPGGIGDTLWFALKDNLNPFLGRVEVTLRLSDTNTLPIVIFDTTRMGLDTKWPSSPGSNIIQKRTGMRLLLNKSSCLEWQSMENSEALCTVKSSPVKLESGQWRRFGLSWAGSRVALYLDGQMIAEEEEVSLPSRMDKYFFVGSDSRGENSLDGWVQKVEILATNEM